MKAYSLDLRLRVVEAIKSGYSATEVSELFHVCRQTVYTWVSLEKEGDLLPKTNFQKGHSHKFKDLTVVKSYVDAHSDQTQKEMAEHFGVSSSTIARALHKLGYTRKKRVKPTQNDVKKSEMNSKARSLK